ncbi:MAG TPA: MBL fold metallo-hydrolase [Pyrinomonadaceae bacterium]|nr:MBL fold metallo-hydrolase [Pyrinomonadaceae bacterium]
MKYLTLAILFLVYASFAGAFPPDSGKTSQRTTTKLADGIYTIRHKDAPDTFPQGNTTVIIGDREVLVVDSCYLPSSAREDIADIKKWTNKPVRYLVNTHWHFDHTMGNGTYWDAFPGLNIIAHIETAQQSAGYNPGWFDRFPKRGDRLKQILEAGKDGNGKVLTEGERKEYADAIAGIAPVQEEFKLIVDRAPNLTFDSEMRVDLGNREVRVMHLGRGNTAGDAIIYLPKEKIVMTGDLVVHPVPYMFGGYPVEFGATLRKLDQLNFETMIPGHGEVMRSDESRAYVRLLVDFIETVTQQVSSETHRLGSGAANLAAVRESVQKKIDVALWRRKFAGADKDEQDAFDTTLAAMITAAHAEINGR